MHRIAHALAVTAILGVAADAFAHGGEFSPPIYRPPRERRPIGEGPPPPKGGPEAPPSATGGGAAVTSSEDAKLGKDEWPSWWLVHRRSLLPARLVPVETPSAGGPSAARIAAIAALRKAAADPDDDIATAGLVALGRVGDVESEALLLGALTDPRRTQTAREAAACGLASLGRTAAASRSRTALEGVAISTEVPGRLRAIAVYALGLRGDPDSLESLAGLAQGTRTDPQVSAAAATSLGLLRAPGAADLLSRLAEKGRTGDEDPVLVRAYAIQGLARLGDASALPVLLRLTADPEPGVRRAALFAASALAQKDDTNATTAFRRRLDSDRDVGCREAACLALGRQGNERARSSLDDAFRGGRAVHRTFAATALGLWARANHDPAAVEGLRASLGGKAPAVERAAASAGVAFGGDRTAGFFVLRTAGGQDDAFLRSVSAAVVPLVVPAEDAVPVLRRLLDAKEPPEVRREAAASLGVIGDAASAASLGQLADGADRLFVRAAATVALGRIGGPGAAERLTAVIERPATEPILRALSAVALGIVLEPPGRRPLHVVAEDLDWRYTTEAVSELLTIL